jgi:hypothetical protein
LVNPVRKNDPGLKSATVVSVMVQLLPRHCDVLDAGIERDNRRDDKSPAGLAEVFSTKNTSPKPHATSAMNKIRPKVLDGYVE